MVLESLRIENLFCYYGRADFEDLAPPAHLPDQNVCIIIGRNNRGKTSFLNCLKLLLGGITDELRRDAALARMPTQRGYVRGEGAWQGLLNRRAVDEKRGPHRVSAKLRSAESTVHLWREWDVDGTERFGASLDGETVAPGEVDDWLADNAPHHALSYFLFDGELVQRLAVRPAEEAGIALRRLFGVEPLEDLSECISGLIARWAVEAAPDARRVELATCQRAIEDLRAESARQERDALALADVLAAHNQRMLEIEARREELARRGSSEDLAQVTGRAQALRETLRSHCRDLLSSELPFLPLNVAPHLAAEARRRLLEHERLSRNAAAAVREVLADLRESVPRAILETPLSAGQTPAGAAVVGFSEEQQRYVRQAVSWELSRHEPPADEARWQCSEASARRALEQISAAEQRTPHKLVDARRATAAELLRLDEEMKRFEQRTLAERQELQRLDAARMELQAEIAKAQAARDTARNKLSALHVQVRQAEARAAAIAAALESAIEQDKRVKRARAVQAFVADYLSASEQARLKAVSDAMQRAFEELFSSTRDVVARIGLGSDLTVQCWDSADSSMAVGSLSAGTKQLIALSLLRGLTASTAVRLPVVVDTPIARLDERHQADVLAHYFPTAGPQVILLPTDSELTRERRARLAGRVYCYYELEHVPGRGSRPIRRELDA